MILDEFNQVLDLIEVAPRIFGDSKNNSEIVGALLQELRKLCLVESNLPDVIWELDDAHNIAERRNPRDHNLPFYSIMIAYAYHAVPDWQWAIEYAERAKKQFTDQKHPLNKAISNWFLGLLRCANKQFVNAETHINYAIDEISSLGEINNQDIIEKIKKTYAELRNQVNGRVNQSGVQKAIDKDFYWLISKLDIFDYDFDDTFIYHELNEIKGLKASNWESINYYIGHLSEILKSQQVDNVLKIPFINLFLAHCYALVYFEQDSKYISPAVHLTEDAICGFQDQDDRYNQAISSFYLALLYYNLSNINESKLKLREASSLFMSVCEDYRKEEQDTDFIDEIKSLQSYLEEWIGLLKSQAKASKSSQPILQRSLDYFRNIVGQLLPIPAETNKAKNFKLFSLDLHPPDDFSPPYTSQLEDDQPSLPDDSRAIPPPDKNKAEEDQPSPPDDLTIFDLPRKHERPQALHITIPIDMQAIQNPNCQSNSLSEQSFFENLRNFNLRIANISQNTVKSTPSALNDTSVSLDEIAPSFPIYGYATAGPQGRAVLPPPENFDLERASIVNKDSLVHLGEEEFKVYSAQGGFLRNLPLKSKKYGWCRVEGNSMNNVLPVPINDGDYVLFNYETRNLDLCVKKIVVATLQNLESFDPRLIVKRLVRFTMEDSDYEMKKYFLKSESLHEVDADGLAFDDIEVVENHQIVGTVVAIAKPEI